MIRRRVSVLAILLIPLLFLNCGKKRSGDEADGKSVSGDEGAEFSIYGPTSIKTVSAAINQRQKEILTEGVELIKDCSAVFAMLPEYNESIVANNETIRTLKAQRDIQIANRNKLYQALVTKRAELAEQNGLRNALARQLAALQKKSTLAQMKADATASLNRAIKASADKIAQLFVDLVLAADAERPALQALLDTEQDKLFELQTEKAALESITEEQYNDKIETVSENIAKAEKKIQVLKIEVNSLPPVILATSDRIKRLDQAIADKVKAQGFGLEELPAICKKVL